MTLSSAPSSSDPPRTSTLSSVTDLSARLGRLPVATPALRAEWGLTIGQVSLATSAAFVGKFIGALLGIVLAVFGERTTARSLEQISG